MAAPENPRIRRRIAGGTLMAIGLLLAAHGVSHGAVRLRLAAGVEVIPFKAMDLESYNTGVGGDLRADVVWGAFSTTSLEMGYREFPVGGAYPDVVFGLHRFGLVQRFYPLYSQDLGPAPYLGVGLAASNEESFSLDIPSADYGGYVVLVGIEIPVSEALLVDPTVRWDFWGSTDYFYSGVGLGVHLIWKP